MNELEKIANAITRDEERAENKTRRIENEIMRINQEQALKSKYKRVSIFGDVAIVSNSKYKQGVVALDGTIIVPFDKYGWIDKFDSGLARVRTHGKVEYNPENTIASFNIGENGDIINCPVDVKKDRTMHPEIYAKWGIINEQGEEVVPLEYDELWSWAGKNRTSTTAIKGGKKRMIKFADIMDSCTCYICNDSQDMDDDYFTIDNCFDSEGNFDNERLEDAIMSGEYVPEDW